MPLYSHYFEVDQADSNVSVANFSLHFCTITAYNGIFQCSLIIARKPTFLYTDVYKMHKMPITGKIPLFACIGCLFLHRSAYTLC